MGRVVNNFHSSLLLVHSSLKSGFQKRQKSSKTNVALLRHLFVYFRYQNGNARLFDFWCKPFYHMELKPGTSLVSIVRRDVNKMTNAFRYLDHVPDFIEFHLLRTSDVVQTSG